MRIMQDPGTEFFLALWLGRWTWTLQRKKAHVFGASRKARLRLRHAQMRFPQCVAIEVDAE